MKHSSRVKSIYWTAFVMARDKLGANALSTTAIASSKPTNKAVPGLESGMDYTRLGSSDLLVSKVCMGTMTFGEQNSLEEGVNQLNLAWDEYGINFLDTAEMYPVPGKAETQGKTESTVKSFLKGRNREDVILATKVAGRSERMTWLRKDEPVVKVNRKQILDAVDGSLKRLGTDYIDLLQIHWPDRYTGGLFGASDFRPSNWYEAVSFEEQLSTLKELVDRGMIRYVGVSNETPYGVCSMAELSMRDPDQYAKIVSVQNSYSLVCRKDYEAGLAEACFHHNVGLLPYSPLAGGILSGKYSNPSTVPKNARLKLFPGFMERYLGSQCDEAVREYCKIAENNGISPTQLASSWCFHNELACSTIIGATSIKQLKENIGSYDIKLDESVTEDITKVYKKYTDPTKAY